MARKKGTLLLGSNLEPEFSAPLDARQVVDSIVDLTNGSIKNCYQGMKVYVKENKKVYLLTADTPSTIDSWSILGAKGDNGKDGKSAYEQAVDGGYQGTEEEFKQALADVNDYAKKEVVEPLVAENFQPVNFTRVTNKALNPYGAEVKVADTQGANWIITEPIHVEKGQIIKWHGTGFNVNTCMICKADSEGNPTYWKVKSELSENGDNVNVKDYLYVVEDDGYIICCANTYYAEPTLEISSLNTVQKIEFDISSIDRQLVNKQLCHMFQKVICIGDSYTKGYVMDKDHALTDKPTYSWVDYMSKLTGAEWINRGVTGATTKSYITNANGLIKVKNDGKAQAYVIGLAINDSKIVDGSQRVSIGTIDDIGTDNDTYYAYLSKIITEIATINPDAVIFVNTCAFSEQERVAPYNDAIRNIVNHYKGTYNIHCIDLVSEYGDLYFSTNFTSSFLGAHPTVIGHAKMAKMYEYVLSDYMNSHQAAFNGIAWIDTDSTETETMTKADMLNILRGGENA